MKFTAIQYAQALREVIEGTAPVDLDKVLDNFVQVLAQNSDLKLFDQIASEFHKEELAKKGIKEAVLTSAHPLNYENEKQILDLLNKHVKGKLELTKQIDEGLVGGVVVQVDDVVIDASVVNSLKRLKKDLSQ